MNTGVKVVGAPAPEESSPVRQDRDAEGRRVRSNRRKGAPANRASDVDELPAFSGPTRRREDVHDRPDELQCQEH
jgi:hypothetical protein